MKILVTGGAGYIGSHTTVELMLSGYEVIVADNFANSDPGTLDNIAAITGVKPQFEEIDLADQERTGNFFRKNRDIGCVIHFAAYKSVGESVLQPLKYYRNNLISLINVLQGMQESGIRDIVFSSSCTVYGQPGQLPVSEDSPVLQPASPYGNTKQICEEIITDTCKSGKTRSILLRYFNPIGAHDTAMIGETPIGEPNCLMPYITQTAIGKRPYLRIWGDDYDTPDGTAIRDYIHVVDLARAHVVALDRLLHERGKVPAEIFNIGTGRGYSVFEVIRSFEKVSGEKLRYEIRERRPGDIEKVWADTTYANQELGWKAERDLDEMTASAWRWERKLANGK